MKSETWRRSLSIFVQLPRCRIAVGLHHRWSLAVAPLVPIQQNREFVAKRGVDCVIRQAIRAATAFLCVDYEMSLRTAEGVNSCMNLHRIGFYLTRKCSIRCHLDGPLAALACRPGSDAAEFQVVNGGNEDRPCVTNSSDSYLIREATQH